jgi:catalase
MADEAGRLAGEDPDFAQRDLFNKIEEGDFPKWRVSVQIMTEEQAASFQYNPFDLTKVWPHGQFPLIEVGEMELNRNPQNYFAEVEQAAYEPANIIPGMGFSPDKMLQARILSYPDAHRYRLGVNYDQIPVNQAKGCPVHNYHRDGTMRVDGNGLSAPNYEPNSFGGPVEDPAYRDPMVPSSGEIGRFNHREGNDDYTQPGNLFRLMTAEEKKRLIANIVGTMKSIPQRIQELQIQHFTKCDPAYGAGVAQGLGLKVEATVGV